MTGNENLTQELIKFSHKIGIDIIGFAGVQHFTNYKKENTPEFYFPTAKCVIILGIHVYDLILDAWSEDQISGKSFHYLDSILEARCYKIKEFLLEQSYKSRVIPYKPGLYLKEAAALAGIGPIGKNNLLLTEKFGPQVRLRALVSEAPLSTGIPIRKSEYCKDCELCVEVCPVDALEGGKYNRESCLTYNLANLNHLSKFSAIWCNKCIEACPVGGKGNKTNLEGYFEDSD